jgi:hypothetical protein
MPTDHIIALLVEERDRLTRAIEVLQGSSGSSRGKATGAAVAPVTSANGGGATTHSRGMSAAARKAVSERMRKYWAAKRKSAATVKKKS